MRRLLVVRLGSMGDIVHTLPAVAALRREFPEATIGWAIEDRWSELLCARGTALSGPRSAQRPLVDTVHILDTLGWRSSLFSTETRRHALSALREIRAAHYQLALDFQGAIKSALLMQWSHTPLRAGFSRPREPVAGLFYTRHLSATGRHISEQNASLAGAFLSHAPEIPEFPLPHDLAAESWCEAILREHGVSEFVILNASAGWGAKCWPSERYGQVARALAQSGLRSLVNIGPGEEELGQAVVSSSGGHAQLIISSVGQLIALCRRARLLIGGDTGPLHLAAALGVPVVGIYGPTDPARNGPIGSSSLVLRHPQSETNHSRLTQPEAGLLAISAEEVVAAAQRLLQEVRA